MQLQSLFWNVAVIMGVQKFLEADGMTGPPVQLALSYFPAYVINNLKYTCGSAGRKVPRQAVPSRRTPRRSVSHVPAFPRASWASAASAASVMCERLCPSPARDFLLRSAEPQEERLHRPAAVHADEPSHAAGPGPAPDQDQGEHVSDLLVQQRLLPLLDQRLLARAARWGHHRPRGGGRGDLGELEQGTCGPEFEVLGWPCGPGIWLSGWAR